MLSSCDSLYILANRFACVKHFFIFLFVSCPRWMFVSVSLAATVAYFNRQSRACQASFSLFAKYFQGVSVAVQLREPGGAATEAIRRDRVKSSRVPLAALGTYPCAYGAWMAPGGEAVLPPWWQNQATMPAPKAHLMASSPCVSLLGTL